MFTLRQFLEVVSIAILLLATSVLIANSIAGQNCLSPSNISSILLNRAPNPTDGKIHVTYSFSEASVPTTLVGHGTCFSQRHKLLTNGAA